MKTLEKLNTSIADIKNEISKNIGKTIRIQENNRQGKKSKEFVGEILNAYSNLFVVKIQIRNSFLNKTFTYVDFLTNEMSFEIE